MDDERRAEVAGRLHGAAIGLLRRARAADPEAGLTPARLSALSVLVFGGARSLGELAAAEQVTAPTMSRLVSWLEAAGYVTREAESADARVVTVRPTRKAVKALEAGRRRRVEHVLGLLDGIGPEEWTRVERAVAVLERALEEKRER